MKRFNWRKAQRFTMTLALSALFSWLPTVASAGSQEGLVEDRWLVGSLPLGDRLLNDRHHQLTVRHTLPTGAQQGIDAWYTFRMRVRVTFREESGTAVESRLQASTNSRASNLVTLRRDEGGVRVFYDGYLGNRQERVAAGSTIEIDYENYVQATGVHAGDNDFELALDDQGSLVKDVLVYPESGLTRTLAPPDQLTLESPAIIRVGTDEQFHIPYSVVRRGDRPDRPLVVQAETAGGPVTLHGDRHSYDSVGTGRRSKFSGVATAPGRYQISLNAMGGYNNASGMVVIQVDPISGLRAGDVLRIAVVAILLLVAGILLVPFRQSLSRHSGNNRKKR